MKFRLCLLLLSSLVSTNTPTAKLSIIANPQKANNAEEAVEEVLSLNDDFELLDSSFGTPFYYDYKTGTKVLGQIRVDYELLKYKKEFTPISSLYLLKAVGTYKSGYTLGKEEGKTDKNYKTNYYLAGGMLKVSPLMSYDIDHIEYESSQYHGAAPIIKATYPQSTTSTVTIKSSFSTEIDASVEGGISDKGKSIIGKIGLKFTIGTENTVQRSEPNFKVSKETSSTEVEGTYFTFTYSCPRRESFTIDSGTIFEMKNINHKENIYLEDEINLQLDYTISTGTWWFGKEGLPLDITSSPKQTQLIYRV